MNGMASKLRPMRLLGEGIRLSKEFRLQGELIGCFDAAGQSRVWAESFVRKAIAENRSEVEDQGGRKTYQKASVLHHPRRGRTLGTAAEEGISPLRGRHNFPLERETNHHGPRAVRKRPRRENSQEVIDTEGGWFSI